VGRERFSFRAIELMLSLPTERRKRTLAIVSMTNTPDPPAQRPDDRMTLGGNFWTLFTQGIWKDLHSVLHTARRPSDSRVFARYTKPPLEISPKSDLIKTTMHSK
jgi:hypothetical protein